MCGIIGAVAQRNVASILIEGLHRLEYRGYDSAGLALVDTEGNLIRLRRLGKVQKLSTAVKEHSLYGITGIAHTRWATHGKPSERNAHPHVSEHIAIVHNGIIENYEYLRNELQSKGYNFFSETDTEVIAHLVHWEQIQGRSLREAVIHAVKKLHSSYNMVVMSSREPSVLIVACSDSSLIIGLGIKENFVASDQLALLPLTRRFILLKKGDIAEVTSNSINIFDKLGSRITRHNVESELQCDDVYEKGIYSHYMQKEIFEQPNAIKNTLKEYINHDKIELNKLNINVNKVLSQTEHIQIIACGTSYNSGMVSRYWFESIVNIHCDVEIASEFRYRRFVVPSNSLIIAISQSGETADTLEALRISKEMGYLSSLAICNISRSSLVRESKIALLTKAGIEISVASTKSFTAQLVILLLLIAKISRIKYQNNIIERKIIQSLKALPSHLEHILSQCKHIKQLARKISDKNHVLFLGRGDQYPIAMEGALKLKEVSYIHAEAYAAGELKHGPLALIDANMPVIVIAPNNRLLEKLKSNIEEIYARGGQIYIFTDKSTSFSSRERMHLIEMPYVEEITAPISYVVPLQLLAYYVALTKGTDLDRPRNLAKSVTVE